MKYLVTGAAGFIGFFLAQRLARENPQGTVYCADNFARGAEDDAYARLLKQPNVRAISGDLADPAVIAELPEDVDVVFHLAALNGTQNFYEKPFAVIRNTYLPTYYLAEKYAGAARKPLFIFASTSEAYASTVALFNYPVPTDEKVPLSIADPLNLRWSYGGSKILGEITLGAAAAQGLPFLIIRYHNVYGPRMGDRHVIPDFLSRMRKNVYELHGHADTRSFLYVDDAVTATLLVAAEPACRNQIVNIGSDEEITMKALGERMMALAGRKGEIALHPSPAGSVPRRAPDITKLKKLTNFAPQVGLDEGLRRAMDFYLHDKLDLAKSA